MAAGIKTEKNRTVKSTKPTPLQYNIIAAMKTGYELRCIPEKGKTKTLYPYYLVGNADGKRLCSVLPLVVQSMLNKDLIFFRFYGHSVGVMPAGAVKTDVAIYGAR